jgi:nicotinate dehydrogenase subunit B
MGAQVDGWWAPALAAAGTLGPAWSEQDFYDYLRHGQSPRHGVAGGPMAPVIAELAELPDEDLRAMAHYLSSLGHEAAASPKATPKAMIRPSGSKGLRRRSGQPRPQPGRESIRGRLRGLPCRGPVPAFGLRPSLAVNSAVRAPVPDNLIHTILQGASNRQFPERGIMPGFARPCRTSRSPTS